MAQEYKHIFETMDGEFIKKTIVAESHLKDDAVTAFVAELEKEGKAVKGLHLYEEYEGEHVAMAEHGV